MWLRLERLVLKLSVVLMMLTGCQTTMTPTYETSGVQVACDSFELITYSRMDTMETRRQIVGHNATWGLLCLK